MQITDHFLYNKSLAYYAIDVVNEAVSDSGTAILKPADPWYPALTDYVNVAFAAAGKASAGAPTKPLLCYNDYAAGLLERPTPPPPTSTHFSLASATFTHLPPPSLPSPRAQRVPRPPRPARSWRL